MPPGYRHLHYATVIGHGPEAFARAAAALLGWRVHHRTGVRLRQPAPAATASLDVDLYLGIGRLAIGVPCRVVYVVDEPNRRGFAYGTRRGHPESGEERFTVALAGAGGGDDPVTFEVVAFSRPGRWFTRAAGPVGTWGQRRAVRAYARAARSFARGA